MIRVPLFGGEKLELGDIVKHRFPVNIEMDYEVVGANPDYAFLVCVSNGEPNYSQQVRIPRIWMPDEQQEAFRQTTVGVPH